MAKDVEIEMETLAACVHSALAVLHALSFVYNVRQGNKFDASVHAFGVLYDGVSAYRHRERAIEYASAGR